MFEDPRAKIMAAVLVATLLVAGHDAHCKHDEVAPRSGGVRDTGYRFSPQDYAGRHRRLSAASWSPIRISINMDSSLQSTLPANLYTLLVDTLLPNAISYISQALQVVPVSGVLRANRTCLGRFSHNGVCAGEGPRPTCGFNNDGSPRAVPEDLLGSLHTCSVCLSDGTCSGCSDHPAGSGVAADFVLFVSASQTSVCSDSTVAYAYACMRDQFDRPVFGAANICPSGLSTSLAERDYQVGVVVHELIHALGFDSSSWPLFRNADGSPQTPREADGLPRAVSTTCVDNVERTVLEVSPSTLDVANVRGTRVNRLVTPRLISVARDVFGCPTLDGVELENQPTNSVDCYGSHWEQVRCRATPSSQPSCVDRWQRLSYACACACACGAFFAADMRGLLAAIVTRGRATPPPSPVAPPARAARHVWIHACPRRLPSVPPAEQRLFMNELMASTFGHRFVYSPLTLALLEDSGWYRANYSMATPLLWGRRRGCAWLTERCLGSSAGPLAGFCDESSPLTGCSADRRARGYCNIRDHPADVPEPFRYFGEPKKGGSLSVADFCPHYRAYSNGVCNNPANAVQVNVRAESYGAEALCVESSLAQVRRHLHVRVHVQGQGQGQMRRHRRAADSAAPSPCVA